MGNGEVGAFHARWKKEGRKGMMGFSSRAGPCANEENWLGLLKPKIM